MKYLFIILLFTFIEAKTYQHTLSPVYHDDNGDMLADSPKNPSDWLDPYTLVFAYTPNESPSIYRKIWKDFILYLEKITGKNVVFFPYQTNSAQLEAMRSGKLHIAGFNTGMVPLAVNNAGFHPVFVMGNEDGTFGYQMEIITYPGSGIHTIDDIEGKQLTLTSPSSNSGCKAALSMLKNRYHLFKHDYKIKFSGRHSNSILGIKNKHYKIAAIASSVRKRMIQRGEINKEDIRIIYRSETFPTTGYGYVYNLKPSLIKKIKKAFQTFSWSDKDSHKTSLKKGFFTHDKFIPVNYKEVWKGVREKTTKYDKGI